MVSLMKKYLQLTRDVISYEEVSRKNRTIAIPKKSTIPRFGRIFGTVNVLALRGEDYADGQPEGGRRGLTEPARTCCAKNTR